VVVPRSRGTNPNVVAPVREFVVLIKAVIPSVGKDVPPALVLYTQNVIVAPLMPTILKGAEFITAFTPLAAL